MLDRIRNKRERAGVEAHLARAFPGRALRGQGACGRAPPGAPVVGVSRVAVRRGGGRVGGRLRRFRERGVGRGPRHRDRGRGPRLFSALARHLLPGADAVPRLPALRRRIQGDGARALRRADVSRRRCGEIVPLRGRRRLSRSNLDYFRHHREKIDYEWENGAPVGRARCIRRRSRSCSGPPREQRRAARAAAQGHRALGAGDVRGGVLPPAQRAARAPRARRAVPRRRLRDELGGQRQGLRCARRSARSTCRRRRAMRAARSARR